MFKYKLCIITYIFIPLILVYAGFTYYRSFTRRSAQNNIYSSIDRILSDKEILEKFLNNQDLLAPIKAKFRDDKIEAI